MSFSMRAVAAAVCVLIVVGAWGCGATRSAAVHPSGFLGDYSALQPASSGGEARVLVSRPGVLGDYDRFILEPVLVYLHPESKAGAIDPAQLSELAAALHDAVAGELEAGGYGVVEEPGPGVLRIRTALTDVDPSRPAANVAAKAAGIATAGSALLVPAVDLGRASIETEMIDSATGERVVAFVDAKQGKRFMGTAASVQKWGHAHAAFKAWAGLLRARIDAAHGAD